MNCFTRWLSKIFYAPGVTPLPAGKTIVLFFILLLNAMTTTMVFSYLPQLVKSFGIVEVKVGTYVGLIASSMFASQALFSLLWGYLGDKFGKNLALVLACFGSAISALLFGITETFWWAIVGRFLQGSFGVFVTAQNVLFNFCDETNKPIAMTICLSAYASGLVLGPSIGGYMVFMRDQYPNLVGKNTFLDTYKIFLPNMVLSVGYILCGFIVIVMSRKKKVESEYESLEGETVPDKINEIAEVKRYNNDANVITDNSSRISTLKVLFTSKQCMLGCVIAVLFNCSAIAFNELYPVWADSSKKYHGLNLSVSEIGTSLMAAALFLMFLQPVFLSRSSSYFGVKKVFFWSLFVQAILYPLYPLIAFVENSSVMWFLLCTNIVATRMAVGASFMGYSIVINNSVPVQYSGSANGLGNALSAIGRLFAPTAFGKLYSWSLTNVKGVHQDGLGFPFNQYFAFFVMGLLSIATAILVLFIKTSLGGTKKINKQASYEQLVE